jgi:hypothetical protein
LGAIARGEHTVIDKLSIRPKMTALLLMDFQRMVVDSYAVDKEALWGGSSASPQRRAIPAQL